ncbi:uncharacterized protein LOC131064733 isoform X2 [Cryptomeria japonica]|uniref:uncharacterized protein LOC131064733 isoform X2 n=2 Tax=Cryptomeria japonica TaxID=3369 RepID=UPI0027DA93C8|nr:uncharacterized protein LOC131064733 isoform X2 [Cryptomeria japonica]
MLTWNVFSSLQAGSQYMTSFFYSPVKKATKRQKSSGDGYQNVPFMYSTEETATAARTSEEAMGSSDFMPPFSVPENLFSHLPPTQKTHQIIARTAKFVSEHGGQSEIVLRVKQGSNPAFGFLMPDHHLHIYFRFLVDHPEVLESEKRSDTEQIAKSAAGEGLSLLGSVYGSGDDEDEGVTHQSAVAKDGSSSIQDSPVDNTSSSEGNSNVLEQAESSVQKISQKDTCSTESNAAPNHDTLVAPKESSNLEVHRLASGDGLRTDALNSHNMAKNDFLSVQTSAEKVTGSRPILELPSFLKRVVQKMVEFIARNGKEFEGIIMNQDRTTGRFPFLLPSNQYHPYYLKVLEAAQKGEVYEDDARAEKSSSPSDVWRSESTKNNQPKKKNNVAGDGSPRVARASTPEEISTTQARKTSDPEKKTKFKLVIGGIKKDAPDYGSGKPLGMTAEAAASAVRAATKKPGSQGSTEGKDNEKKESGMSADAAAAIVMAATRGLRRSQQGGTSETENFHVRSLGKTLQGISEESEEVGSAGVSSSHCDASNFNLSNGGMALPQSGISGSNSKLVMDVCFPGQQSEDFSGASGSILRLDDSNKKKDDTSVAKVMVKAAARAAACEADSSESCLSREEKLRAERLKRAKMFAALIKNEHSALQDKNDRSTPEGAGSLQNESDSKATVCGSSYNDASVQLDALKGTTSDTTTKEESRHMRVLTASEECGNKSTAKCLDANRHSHRHRHHHQSDYHKSSKSRHENSDDHVSYVRRHKHESGKSHKDPVTERYSSKRHHESSSQRSSDDVHRGYRHRSNFKDDDSGERHHYDSKEAVHGHRSKDITAQKHTKSSSGKEHRKDSSHGKEHTKGSSHGKEHMKEFFPKENSSKERGEKFAGKLSKDTEALASERSKSPTHATDVPDDLRAKVRAMLLATL